jgi:membrane protease YdiL (CAAX protease family)
VALPTHVRAIAGVLAALVGLALGSALFTLAGEPIVATAQLVVAGPTFAALAWVAAWPEAADGTLRERWDVDLADGRTLAAAVIHLVFAFALAWLTLVGAAGNLAYLVEEGQHPAAGDQLTSTGILAGLVFNAVLFVVAAVTWIVLKNDRSLREVPRAMGLTREGVPRAVVGGVLAAVGGILVLGVLGLGLQQLGLEPQNPQAEAIADALTWQTALAVAALAAIGEEAYFRGFLLPRTGNAVQAVLFGLVHVSYLTPLQVVLPLLLGLGFGWLTRETNLWGAIVAHFFFNAAMLLGTLYGSELAAVVPA